MEINRLAHLQLTVSDLHRTMPFRKRPQRWGEESVLLIAVVAGMLAACSGSGGDGAAAPSPPPTVRSPTAEDLANAGASQLNILLKADSNELVATWVDTFSAESGYRVERQSEAGAWEIQESLLATSGTGTAFTWQRIVDRSAIYRVVAQRDGYVVPLEAEGNSNISVDLTARTMALLVDQPDPLHDTVQLSVEGAAAARSVRYFSDLEFISASTAGPSFSIPWNARTATDGGHLLLAHVDRAPGLRVELRRVVTVDNPDVAVSLAVSGTSGIITLSAAATSDVGIQLVEFFLNDTSIAVLTSPSGSNEWTHALNTQGMAAGLTTIRVVATDNAGEQAEASRRINIDNLPVLTLEAPLDGAIVSGSLEVRGATADDLPGTVTNASLGDVPIFETSQSPFARSYSLAGLPSGQYTLTVQARDAAGHRSVTQRTVIVTVASDFSYEVIGSHQAGTSLLDTGQGKLLYQTPDGTVRLRQANGAEVDLAGSAGINPLQYADSRIGGPWQMSGDHVTVSGRIESSPATTFVFDSTGQREEIPYTFADGEFETFLRSGLHGAWLVWGGNRIYMRNLSTQAPVEAPVQGRLFSGHAFVDTLGSERLFFSRETGQQQSSATIDMFCYSLADRTTTQLSGSDGRHLRPKTDGLRVAWEKAQHQQNVLQPPFGLFVAPVTNPTASTLRSASMMMFDLNDGILAWLEAESNASVLKVDDGTETITVSATTSTVLYSTSSGHVVFGENGKLHTWSRAHGRRVLLEALPRQILQDGSIVFFTTGASGVTIYRSAL